VIPNTSIKKFYKKKKGLFANTFYLFIQQGYQYLLPLLTLPYLIRVFGIEKYGMLMFIQAFVLYFSMVIDYGFLYTGTRSIAIHANDKKKTSEIFSSIMITKLLFFLVSFIIFIILIFSIDFFKSDRSLYIITFAQLFGLAINPVWLFQGIQKMKYIAFPNLIVFCFIIILMFLFVRHPSDLFLFQLIVACANLLGGVISLFIVFRMIGLKFYKPEIKNILQEIKNGFHLFNVTFWGSIFVNSITFLLGIFCGNTYVGYYKPAETLMRGITTIFYPVRNALFPYIAAISAKAPSVGKKLIRKYSFYITLAAIIPSLITFIFPDTILKLITGNIFATSSLLIRIFSFWMLITVIGNNFFTLGIITFDLVKRLNLFTVISAILHIIISIILLPVYKHIGAAIVLISWDFTAMLFVIYIFTKRNVSNASK